MHIITKFLVILASVLAVLLAGLTIAYTANADRVVAENQSMRERVAIAEASAAKAESRVGETQDELNADYLALQTTATQAQTTLSRVEADLSEAQAEVQRLSLEQQKYQNQIEQFLALSEQDKALRESQQEEIRAMRDEVNSQARRIIDLIDRNSDLVSQLENAQNTIRALREVNAASRRGGSGDDGVAALPSTFRARVISVVEDNDGTVLVEVNAGRSDRLSKGMELTVSRNGRFVAKIKIDRVDLNVAVGRVVLTGSNGAVRNDDEIRPSA